MDLRELLDNPSSFLLVVTFALVTGFLVSLIGEHTIHHKLEELGTVLSCFKF